MSWIPDSIVVDSGFHRLKLPEFRIPDYLTWGETRHVKFSKPISGCSSLKHTDLRGRKSVKVLRHLVSFSSGSRASMCIESKIIPANCKTVSGPTVFPGARGTPIYSHRETRFAKSRLHWSLVGAMKRKSSNMCKTELALSW